MERTALLSALAPRVRPTIVDAPNGRNARRLASWLAHESRSPVAIRFRRSPASPSVAVSLPSSRTLLVRATFRAASHQPNRAALARDESRTESSRTEPNRAKPSQTEPSRTEPSRVKLSWVESSRTSRNRMRGARAPHLSDALRVRHRVSRVRVLCHTEQVFFFFLSVFDAPCRTLDSREDWRSRPNSLSARADNVIRCIVSFQLNEGISEKCGRQSAL